MGSCVMNLEYKGEVWAGDRIWGAPQHVNRPEALRLEEITRRASGMEGEGQSPGPHQRLGPRR